MDTNNSPYSEGPTFHLFMKLAPELRERIYAFALACDLPIRPHLCDNTLKFHDDNQKDHDAIDALLGITRVSNKVRTEALPIFYSANTFQVGDDTATYFDRLEHLGRFHMIRNVQFYIMMRKEVRAAAILRGMNQFIKSADAYEKELLAAHELKERERLARWEAEKERYERRWIRARQHIVNGASASLADLEHVRGLRLKTLGCMSMASKIAADLNDPNVRAGLVGGSFTALTKHPHYLAGGLMELQTFITLRKLTSMFTASSSPTSFTTTSSPSTSSTSPSKKAEETYTSTLVLPLPSAQIFTAYSSLKWFTTVCHGLGIHLHVIENVPLDHVEKFGITVTWRQKWQKKDFFHNHHHQHPHQQHRSTASDSDAAEAGARGAGGAGAGAGDVYKRILEMFPDLESMPRPVRNTFYRRNCKDFDIRWYSVETEGGRVW